MSWCECCTHHRCEHQCPLLAYHTHRELELELQQLVQQHPQHAKLFSIGKSTRNRDLMGIRISKDVVSLSDRPTAFGNENWTEALAQPLSLLQIFAKRKFEERPKVKLVANIHGNEPVGREILIYLARHILEGESRGDDRAMDILENVDLHILPSANPDGFARSEEGRCDGDAGRRNEAGVNQRSNLRKIVGQLIRCIDSSLKQALFLSPSCCKLLSMQHPPCCC